MQLQFGLGSAVPDSVTTAWGARWIFPNEMLGDRQSVTGDDFGPLKKWLKGGAIRRATENARYAADAGWISQEGRHLLILFKDSFGVIVGDPCASYGYLYVAAWVHHGDSDKQPPIPFLDLTQRQKIRQIRSARVRN